MATKKTKAKRRPDPARTDLLMAQRQAYELRKLRGQQQRVRDLARSLVRAARAADAARALAAGTLVVGTDYTVVPTSLLTQDRARLEAMSKRVDELTLQVQEFERMANESPAQLAGAKG